MIAFDSKYSPQKLQAHVLQTSSLTILLLSKQIFQRLPIALAQAEETNTSENLLNEIRQIIYSLYQGNGVLTI